MLSCKHLAKKYGERTVLTDVTLRLEPGQCTCIVGASGSGKSTLVRLLLGEELPTGGIIEVDGVSLRDLPPAVLQLYRRKIGIIFQEPILHEYLTVAESIALPLDLQHVEAERIRPRVKDLLQKLSLTHLAERLPASLSQGEKALVCIARALVGNPAIVLADEPLQLLDTSQSSRVVALLKGLQEEGVTLLLLSSHPALAGLFDARMLALEKGKIIEATPAERVSRGIETDLPTESVKESDVALVTVPRETVPLPVHSAAAVRGGGRGGKIKITSIGS